MIAIEKQLSIFLDNRPGMLARMCQALAHEGINIAALSISDTVDHVVVRIVVTESQKAATILQRLHAPVQEREVVVLDLPNQPGMLAKIAEQLAEAGINIEYAYCTSSSSQKMGSMVLRTSDIEATINALS